MGTVPTVPNNEPPYRLGRGPCLHGKRLDWDLITSNLNELATLRGETELITTLLKRHQQLVLP